MMTQKRKKFIIGLVIILVIVIVVTAVLIYLDQKKQNAFAIEGITGDDYSEEIEYQGRTYTLNHHISSVLVIGVDSTGELTCNSRYGEAGQADSVTMIILDDEKQSIRILPVSRDTITEVHHFSVQGYDQGTTKTHLGFAFTFGDGASESCANTCLAVSDLLKGVRVNHYGAANLESLSEINSILGGVMVTVPNDDIAHLHPECVTGAQITLDENNVRDFLRYRDTAISFSNNGRMARNRAFFEGAIQKIRSFDETQINEIWSRIEKAEGRILSSFTQKQFLQMMDQLRHFSYDPSSGVLALAGTDDIAADGHDAFYPDEEALMKLTVNTFYKEKQ